MGIGHHGGGAEGKHSPGELSNAHHSAFNVNMRIDKAGGDIHAAGIDDLFGVIRTEPDDISIGNGDIAAGVCALEDGDLTTAHKVLDRSEGRRQIRSAEAGEGLQIARIEYVIVSNDERL